MVLGNTAKKKNSSRNCCVEGHEDFSCNHLPSSLKFLISQTPFTQDNKKHHVATWTCIPIMVWVEAYDKHETLKLNADDPSSNLCWRNERLQTYILAD